ncbi:MAG: crotonase/enoyl-CoA hydratase family protein [Pseudomonadota bacterium]
MNSFVSIENLLTAEYSQLGIRYDNEHKTLWAYMAPLGRPCFTKGLLTDIIDLHALIANNEGSVPVDGKLQKLEYAVLASKVPGIFNLGGDLNVFRECIIAGDRETLSYYATLCIENIWLRLDHFRSDITTISLIQGQALGGGMEAALTADVIVAERSATMGLPEILFNLFPGMGALSLLARRVGMRKAEEMVLSGNIYTAEKLFEMGVVDILVEDGAGDQAVHQWISRNRKCRNGYQAVQRAKNVMQPISYQELMDIANIWVDAALKLTDRDLKLMARLVRAQNCHSITTDTNPFSKMAA